MWFLFFKSWYSRTKFRHSQQLFPEGSPGDQWVKHRQPLQQKPYNNHSEMSDLLKAKVSDIHLKIFITLGHLTLKPIWVEELLINSFRALNCWWKKPVFLTCDLKLAWDSLHFYSMAINSVSGRINIWLCYICYQWKVPYCVVF